MKVYDPVRVSLGIVLVVEVIKHVSERDRRLE